MKKFSLATIITYLAVIVLVIWAAYIAGVASASTGTNDALFLNQLGQIRTQQSPDLIKKAMKMLDEEYYKPLDAQTKEKMMYGAIEGMVGVLRFEPYNDEFTHFYDPELYKDLQAQTTGEYAGVGILMGISPDGMFPEVNSVFPATPAEDAGINAADIITEVDGDSTFGMILPEVATRIKGETGTQVHLKVFRPAESDYLEFDVTRRDVQFSSVSDIELLDGNIGFLKINNFAEQTGSDFRDAVEDLLTQGMESLVIDLRNNSGGLFQAAIEVANCFVKAEDVIVRIYDRDAEISSSDDDGIAIKSDPDVQKYDIPLVVLINENSASSSEILVGALQDNGLAKVVGEKSFGKGVIQAVNPMDYENQQFATDTGEEYTQKVVKSALALTIGKYFTPDRHDIHRRGIEPNIWHTIDNRLATEQELIELEAQINEKTEELRQLRATLYKYLRDNDTVKDHGVEVAGELARGIEVADVPKLVLEEEEHLPLTAANVDADENTAGSETETGQPVEEPKGDE